MSGDGDALKGAEEQFESAPDEWGYGELAALVSGAVYMALSSAEAFDIDVWWLTTPEDPTPMIGVVGRQSGHRVVIRFSQVSDLPGGPPE